MPAINHLVLLQELQSCLNTMKNLSPEECPLMLDRIRYKLAQFHQFPALGSEQLRLQIIQHLAAARNDLASRGIGVQDMTPMIAEHIKLLDQCYPPNGCYGQYGSGAFSPEAIYEVDLDDREQEMLYPPSPVSTDPWESTRESTTPIESVSPAPVYTARALVTYDEITLEPSTPPPYHVRLLGVTFEHTDSNDVRAGSHSWIFYDYEATRYVLCAPQSSTSNRENMTFAPRDVRNLWHLDKQQAGDVLRINFRWPGLRSVHLIFDGSCEKSEFVSRLKSEAEWS